MKYATVFVLVTAWSSFAGPADVNIPERSSKTTAPRFSAKLPAEKKILHALSRLTFGARAGDIERVRAMGLEKWIDLELHPERIGENPALEVKLRPFEVLRMSSSQIRQIYPPGVILRALAEGRVPYPTDPEHRRPLEFAVRSEERRVGKECRL